MTQHFGPSASPCGEIRIIRSQAPFLRRWTAYVLRTAAQRIDPICPLVSDPEPLSEAEIAEIKARWLAMHDTGRIHLPDLLRERFGISTSEARRGIVQGGVRIDGTVITDLDISAETRGSTLAYGKRREAVI